MKIQATKISAFGASLVVTGLLALGGVASADGFPGWGGGGYGWNGGPWGWGGNSFFNRLDNRIFTERNTNDIRVNNTNNQFAQSGDAIVSGNLFGGNAITGDAINTNNTSTNVGVFN